MSAMNHRGRKRTRYLGHNFRRPPHYHSSSAQSGAISPHPPSLLQQAHIKPDAKKESPFGFKVLYEPIATSIAVDIIAIHGLNGHREGTWIVSEAGGETLWLKDLLPKSISNARVVSYGYDAAIDGLSQQTISGHAQDFVVRLTYFRMTSLAVKRPIIFIAHGTGGIILQLALLEAFRAHGEHLPDQEDLKLSTFGIIFLGTPHQGLSVSSFNSTFQLGVKTERDIRRHLRPNSEYLQDLVNMFTPIRRYLDIKFIHETRPEPGQTHLTVPRSSAALSGAVNIQVLGMNRDHLALTKFTSEQDGDYQALAGMLQAMVRAAPSKVVAHWETSSSSTMETHESHFDLPVVPAHTMQKNGGIVIEVKNQYHFQNYRIVGCQPQGPTKIALVKVFRGPRAKDRHKATLRFAKRVLHPQLLQVIGHSESSNSESTHYVVYDGEYSHSTPFVFAKALQMGPSRSMLLGVTMIHDVASALSFLTEIIPVTSLGASSFEILLKNSDGGLVLSFEPPERGDPEHDDAALTNSDPSHSIPESDGTTLALCQKLCRQTLNSANELLYGLTPLENTDFDDDAYPDMSVSHSIIVDAEDAMIVDKDDLNSSQFHNKPYEAGEALSIPKPAKSTPTAKQLPRRQYSWKAGQHSDSRPNVQVPSLSLVVADFSLALDRHRLNLAVHQTRRRQLPTNLIPHSCPGYQREEITLSTRVLDIAVFASESPLKNEVCLVCRQVILNEILRCHCRVTNYDGSEVVKCTHCLTWQHKLCVAPLQTTHACYSCARAEIGQIDGQSGKGTTTATNTGPLDNAGLSSITPAINFAISKHQSEKAPTNLNNMLSPSFGNGQKLDEYLKGLDEKLKALVAISATSLASHPSVERTWDHIQSTFMNNPSAQLVGESTTVAQSFKFENVGLFQSKGKLDPIVDEVKGLWRAAIPFGDIQSCTKINVVEIANLVAKINREERRDPSVSSGSLRESMISEVGTLRYPDMHRPYITIYRLQIQAYAQSGGLSHGGCTGIRTELDLQSFKPTDEFIAGLREEAKEKMVALAVKQVLGSSS